MVSRRPLRVDRRIGRGIPFFGPGPPPCDLRAPRRSGRPLHLPGPQVAVEALCPDSAAVLGGEDRCSRVSPGRTGLCPARRRPDDRSAGRHDVRSLRGFPSPGSGSCRLEFPVRSRLVDPPVGSGCLVLRLVPAFLHGSCGSVGGRDRLETYSPGGALQQSPGHWNGSGDVRGSGHRGFSLQALPPPSRQPRLQPSPSTESRRWPFSQTWSSCPWLAGS